MKYFILLAALLPATTVAVSAQMNPTLYHMKDLPLNTQLNPAFQPRNGSLYVGFPGLTSLAPSLMLSGEGLTLGNGYLSPNYGAIVRGAGDFGAAAFGYEHNLINVGFMLKNVYFTFDSKFKVNVEGRIPKDLQQLMWYGNGHDETLGKPLNFEGMGVSALGYSEISLGVSAEVVKNVFAGAKLKYLQGLFYGNVELGEGSSFVTNSSTYGITMTLNPDIFLAGVPVTVPQGEILVDELTAPGMGSYKFDAGSRGVAFDLGGSWDLPWVKGLNVSASVLDVGFISWSGHKLAGSSTISFDGFSMSGDGSDFASSLIDSVKQKTSVTAATGSECTWLSPTVYAGVSYEVLKHLNVGALVGYRFSQRENMPLVALSANTQGFMVNASVSYSYFNRSSNVGVGLLLGRKLVQWHLIADNLLAASYKTAQNVNFRMGVNFLFGSDRSKRRPLIGGDALAPDADAELADTAAALRWQPVEDQQGAPTATRDSAASPRYRQAQAPAQADTATRGKSAATGSARKPAKQALSKEELLRRAMAEEVDEDRAAVKSGKKQPKSAKSSAVQKKTSREALLERAMREEAEEEAAASPKAKSAKAEEKNK